jgi:general nucleoside transport system permease protein
MQMYNNLITFLSLVLILAIPLIITATGGLFTERSGVTNIALEGIMILGAFTALIVTNRITPESVGGPFVLYLIGMFIAIITGILVSILHSIASIKMKADQIISATAINTLAPALALFLTYTLTLGAPNDDKLPIFSGFKIAQIPILSDIPFIGDLFFQNFYPALYFGIIVIIAAYIILYKTKFGLRLRSCGENPHAADSAGINIYKMRYIGVSISGGLAGLGGFFYITSFTTSYHANVAGYGFLAIAVLIFGNWKPLNIALTALLFSTLLTFAQGIAFFPELERLVTQTLNINLNLISMLPYLVTIIVLVLTSKNSRSPKALGQTYDKGQR